MTVIDPVIFVPGITATYLKDEYSIDPDLVWSVLNKNYERILLHPNDLRYEASEPALVKPDKIFEVAYSELIEELRFNLRLKEDQPVPVYPFAYDWRMPLELVEEQLAGFIEEVIDRTKLIPHYHKAGYSENPKVNLIGHSMGGLVITGYLQNKKNNAPVNKVVTLATPYRGSFEAVIKVTTGTANLGTSAPSSREREAARITPALYYLIPSFKNGLDVAQNLPGTLYDPGLWQTSVINSISEIIRLKGFPTQSRKSDARKLFNELLKSADEHRKRIGSFKLNDAGLSKEKWLAVAGVDSTTRVKLKVIKKGNSPQFEFNSSDRKNMWSSEDPFEKRLTGDGTVPFEGAIPDFLNEENLVLITPDDFGYWEIQDKLVTKVAGFHGILPNMNMLHRLIVRFLTGGPDKRNNTWGRPAPGIADSEWNPPLKLTLKKE